MIASTLGNINQFHQKTAGLFLRIFFAYTQPDLPSACRTNTCHDVAHFAAGSALALVGQICQILRNQLHSVLPIDAAAALAHERGLFEFGILQKITSLFPFPKLYNFCKLVAIAECRILP